VYSTDALSQNIRSVDIKPWSRFKKKSVKQLLRNLSRRFAYRVKSRVDCATKMVWMKNDNARYREPEHNRRKRKIGDEQSNKRKKRNEIVRRDSDIDRSRQDSCEVTESKWFGVIDDLLLCGLFGGGSTWGQKMPMEQQVVVRVEVSTQYKWMKGLGKKSGIYSFIIYTI
jgi:hypothetical protein